MIQQLLTNIVSNFNVKYIWYIIFFPFVVFWIWTVLYATKDISHRTDSVLYQVFLILLVFLWTPLVWFPLYFVFRPARYLDDISWRKSIENLSIECLDCNSLNYKDNNYCVNCGSELKLECKECSKKYYIWYDYCPHCGAPNLDIEES